MVVWLEFENAGYSGISQEQSYFVIGIEADHYRILNDFGKPYLYPPDIFTIIDPREPQDWIAEYGDDNERYAYPEALNKAGFFEDYFDGKVEARSQFWHVVNNYLSDAA
jgi:hypothetical protein